jgi:FADH2 O2-dependent halogenase
VATPPTVPLDFDVAIVGGGFAGSLLAQISRQLGLRVLLVERGRHPRFAIGESSTPVANLLLEQLADRYDLPNLKPLCKWGTWQASHPHLPCGLKRGFSFYRHDKGKPWLPDPDRTQELLVAASPSEPIADTHWYRPDFDTFLFAEAARLGAEVCQDTELNPPEFGTDHVRLTGRGRASPLRCTTRLLIDASGPRGFLHRALDLSDVTPKEHLGTESVFCHFRNVPRWESLHPPAGTPPFPPDDAALHHVFDDGWMWVLRFNNGITSAGFARRPTVADAGSAAERWRALLNQYPSVSEAFEGSEPIRPFTHLPQLSFRTSQCSGQHWAMLPIAAGFVDPLLSTGFPLTLLGIERIAHLLSTERRPDFTEYGRATFADLDQTFDLVAALYRVMPDFETFRELSMLYFTAAIFSETARRLDRPSMAPGFLLREHPTFGPGLRQCLARAGREPGPEVRDAIRTLVEPFNLGGLCRPQKKHWYACEASDLYESAARIGASREEITAMLRRTGFDAV